MRGSAIVCTTKFSGVSQATIVACYIRVSAHVQLCRRHQASDTAASKGI